MTVTEPEVLPLEVAPRPREKTDTEPREETRTKRQPPYAVVLHNDDLNGFPFVIGVLRKVFRCGLPKAYWLTLKVHLRGRGVIWSGTLELAELKAEQVRACGPDPHGRSGTQPLTTSVEPLPG
jgi:ATP-dependent Clp protease adaptor protein ClpS